MCLITTAPYSKSVMAHVECLMGCHPRVGQRSAIFRAFLRNPLGEPQLFRHIFAFCLEVKYLDAWKHKFVDESIERYLSKAGIKKNTDYDDVPCSLADGNDTPLPRLQPYIQPASVRYDSPKWFLESPGLINSILIIIVKDVNVQRVLQHLTKLRQCPSWFVKMKWRNIRPEREVFIRGYQDKPHILIIHASGRDTEFDKGLNDGFLMARFNHLDVPNIEHVVVYDFDNAIQKDRASIYFDQVMRHLHLFRSITVITHEVHQDMHTKFEVFGQPKMLRTERSYIEHTLHLLDVFLDIHHNLRYMQVFLAQIKNNNFVSHDDMSDNDYLEQLWEMQQQLHEAIEASDTPHMTLYSYFCCPGHMPGEKNYWLDVSDHWETFEKNRGPRFWWYESRYDNHDWPGSFNPRQRRLDREKRF